MKWFLVRLCLAYTPEATPPTPGTYRAPCESLADYGRKVKAEAYREAANVVKPPFGLDPDGVSVGTARMRLADQLNARAAELERAAQPGDGAGKGEGKT